MNKPTINQLMDEISELKANYRVNMAGAIADATAEIEKRLVSRNQEVNCLLEERAEIATQLYKFGLFLDTDGVIKTLNC